MPNVTSLRIPKTTDLIRLVAMLPVMATLLLLQSNLVAAAEDEPAILVPDGFRVRHYADDDLAHDIHSLTIDAKGRVVVSGPGYVRILIDADNDGTADSFLPFVNAPKTGAQGMYFMGPHLLCSGDEGLQIFRDDNRDDRADGPPQTFLKIKAGGEHHVHSIQRGPDGWWYIIAGNMAGVTKTYATLSTSPLKNPEAGVLMRLKPDLSGGEVLSEGLRNAYDFAFNESGDVFTFDSDGERDVSLPWYLPCRVFHLTPQSHAGWISRSWKRPDAFPDMPPVVAEFGRGSPTGVTCYRHRGFPGRYEGALFIMDWTFGRIMAVSLEEQNGFWKANSAVFARGTGQFGFAPTDIEVGPRGDLFVSVGGRGTRGGVYRIYHEEAEKRIADSGNPGDTEADKLTSVLDAPQPFSSWSRNRWVPVAKELGKDAFVNAATDEGRRPIERVRAIEILTELFEGVDPATVRILTSARSVPVRARTAWSVGRSRPESPNATTIFALLNDPEPLVVRAALESLTTTTDRKLLDHCLPRLAVALGAKDAAVRKAASSLMRNLSGFQRKSIASLISASPRAQVWLAMSTAPQSGELNVAAARTAARVLNSKATEVELKQEAVRLLQRSLGDVGPGEGVPGIFESYTPQADLEPHQEKLNPVRILMALEFPSGNAEYDKELIRTIAMLGASDAKLIDRLLSGITEDSLPPDDIHRLVALTRVAANRTIQQSQATANALLNLEHKIVRMNLKQDSNWDDRVAELYLACCSRDAAVAKAIVSSPLLGLPGHVLFLSHISPKDVQQAVDHFAIRCQQNEDYAWTNDVVFVLGKSTNPQHRQLVREQAVNPAVLDSVLMVLSTKPQSEDRPHYLVGLNSPQPSTLAASVQALTALPKSNDAAEQYTLLSAARRLGNSEKDFELREAVIRLLQNNLLQSFGFVFGKAGHKPQPEAFDKWADYLRTRFPDYDAPIEGGKSAREILTALDRVKWDTGDITRGAALFAKLTCSRCHGGRKALGPDLKGVGKRFSRPDLFAAIVVPDRHVSDRYQVTTVQTTEGTTYSGLIVYESVDGMILRDSEHKTYRIEAAEIEERVRRRVSLMPAGLLKQVSDQDLADLDAYLRQL